ncbi:MAG: hypothetical protein ACKV19_27790 [Verrucomicrobiales bacterium]
MANGSRKSFLLRIDPKLWAELEAWAHDDLRSVNGQIEFLLKTAVNRRKAQRSDPGEERPAGEAAASEPD